MSKLITLEPSIQEIVQSLFDKGYKSYIVGGAVRDALLKIIPKDIDVEVYGISYESLMEFLHPYGSVDLVGKKFGVIVFTPTNGEMKYDFSIPRKENKSGLGHKEFEIIFDEKITLEEASTRRDFRINALAYDSISETIIDCHGGTYDLHNGIISHVSDQFEEDYLRILRAMGFQSRFDFIIAESTTLKMKKMLGESFDESNEFLLLPKSRLLEEWRKWAEKGTRHDLIFEFMRSTNLINYYPTLKALKDTPQDEVFHPEGNVQTHTEMCLRQIDRIISENNISGNEKIILVMSTLLHDVAKPPTTKEEIKRGRMTITSNGHEAMGGVMAREFLEGIGFYDELITPICKLIENHLAGVNISLIPSQSGKVKAVKKLSRRLFPATINQLLFLMMADTRGRGEASESKVPTGYKEISEIAQELTITNNQYEYLLMGRHLIQKGMKPSQEFGIILKKSYEAQENGQFNDVDGAVKWLEEYLKDSIKNKINEKNI